MSHVFLSVKLSLEPHLQREIIVGVDQRMATQKSVCAFEIRLVLVVMVSVPGECPLGPKGSGYQRH